MKSLLVFASIGFSFSFGTNTPKKHDLQQSKQSWNEIRSETMIFLDGSALRGNLLELTDRKILHWNHLHSAEALKFNFQAIESILFNRSVEKKKGNPLLTRVFLHNGDSLKGNLVRKSEDEIDLATGFEEIWTLPLKSLQKIEFLPPSHDLLFGSSDGMEFWKTSNSKSWTEEQGDLVSIFSGSTGLTLPEKDALEVSFSAHWERSFYLAIRFFSDSDGSSYGDVGYHLSFSNNRINLQVNKRKMGRVMRESIGSILVPEMKEKKEALFSIFAHRVRKEFLVVINGREVGRWKDLNEDFFPDGNGILFINQGGNSYLRLKELTINGWNGDYFPLPDSTSSEDQNQTCITFVNGDSTTLEKSSFGKDMFTIECGRGNFEVPMERIRSLRFPMPERASNRSTNSELLILNQSMGKLNFDIESIRNEVLSGHHSYLGKFSMPLSEINCLFANLDIKEVQKYLDQLSQCIKHLKDQTPSAALNLLNQTDPKLRSWYWNRLKFLADNHLCKELSGFAPHPDSTLSGFLFTNELEEFITQARDGSFALWNGREKIASGSFDLSNFDPIELGRRDNEGRKIVRISRPFWLGETEVTKKQYEKVVSGKAGDDINSKLPAAVTWFEAIKFCDLLNQKIPPPDGYVWRLPTEAEWEYACRNGSENPYGQKKLDPRMKKVKGYHEILDPIAWYSQNSSGHSHPVGKKEANSLGLFDMHGNLWEWCMDAVGKNKSSYASDRKTGVVDPYNSIGGWRSLRGGSFEASFERCRSAYRGANSPSDKSDDLGFRVSLAPTLEKETKREKIELSSSFNEKTKAFGIRMIPVSAGEFIMGSRGWECSPRILKHPLEDFVMVGSPDGKLTKRKLSQEQNWPLLDLNASITQLTCSDTGLVLGGTKDGQVFLYDLGQSKLIRIMQSHQSEVTALALDFQSLHFATACLNGILNLYSLVDGSLIWRSDNTECRDAVDYLEFSRDSQSILSVGIGSSARLHNVLDGSHQEIFENHKGEWIKVRWHPDGETIVCLSKSGTLALFEPDSQLFYKSINLNLRNLRDFVFSSDGKLILVGNSDGFCSLRKFPNLDLLIISDGDAKLAGTPDYYFALSRKRKFQHLSLAEFIKEYDTNGKSGIDHSPDEKWIVTSLDGALRLWRKETKTSFAILGEKLSSPFVDCAFSFCGRFIAGKLQSGHYLVYPSKNDHQTKFSESTMEVREWFQR